ncbi:MAG: hypothetical protein V1865_02260 [bacterium]
MPRGKKHKKPGRPSKIDEERDQRLVSELERLKGILESDDEDELEEELREVRARERKQRQKIAEMEVRNKRLLMWVVIVFIMVIIAIFWMMNLDVITKQPSEGPQVEVKSDSLEQAKEELTDTMDKIRDSIDEIKKQAEKLEEEEGIDAVDQVYFLPVNEDISE